MNFKQIMLIGLIIIILSSVSFVCASNSNDVNDFNLTESTQDSIYVDNLHGNDKNNGQTWDDSLKTISNAVKVANKDDTVYLANGTYGGLKNTKITIDKSISFIGDTNTKIDGANKNYLFIIKDDVKVTFKNIKFINAFKNKNIDGSSDNVYGAALEINNAEVIIENCQFINNNISHGSSGDVYGASISNLGNLSVFNSQFIGSSMDSGDGHYGFGSAIYSSGNLVINNSSFTKSSGNKFSRGSAIYNAGLAIIDNSTIADTYTKEESMGSAIFNSGVMTLSNSIIENNTIERYDFNYIYGNVFNSGSLIATCNIFRNNTGYYKQPNSEYEGCPTIYNIGDLNLTYNLFIDNIGFNKVVKDVFLNGGNSVHIDNNWWGSNNNPSTTKSINFDKATSWIVLDISPKYSNLDMGQNIDIVASWRLSNSNQTILQLPFNLIFTSDNQSQKRLPANGLYVYNFNSTQTKGSYEVNVGFYRFNQTIQIDVGKVNTTLSVDVASEIYFDENLVVNVVLKDENSKNVNGVVKCSLNGEIQNITISRGRGTATFSKLIPDDYELKLTYDGSDVYSKSFKQVGIVVKKRDIDLKIDDIDDIMVGQNFSISVNLNCKDVQGPANLYINGILKQVIYLKNGNNLINFTNFRDGEYNITVGLMGNQYYNPNNASVILNVNKFNVAFDAECENISVGQNAILKINSTNNFTGELIISINGVNSTVFIKNKTSEFILANLSSGKYDVDLIFKGNDLFKPANYSLSFEVSKFSSAIIVNIEDNTITVNTNPNNCTGSISLYINRKHYESNLKNGVVTFDVDFDEGTNYIYVIYNGDDYYNQSSWNTTIGQAEAYAIMADNITAWEYNDFNYTAQIFEANGMAMPNKAIIIKIDSQTFNITTNNLGVAVLPLNLASGNYTVIAIHNNLTTVSSILVKVIDFNLTSNNVSYGENIVVVASFEENITGKVNFTVSNNLTNVVDIINGKASFIIENLKCGIYNVEAVYIKGVLSKSKTTAFKVDKLDSKFSYDISEAGLGQSEIITVTADNLTGQIKFIIDDGEYLKDIENSQAILELDNLAGGIHKLTIIYLGDEYHKNSTVETEFGIKTLITDIILSVNDTTYGKGITVVAKLNENATGNVSFTVNNLKSLSNVENGIATWTFGGFDVGTYRISADYLGDNTFLSSGNSTSFKINKASSSIDIYVDGVYLDENIRIYAKLSPNATGNVSFSMKDYYSPRNKPVINSQSSWYISPLNEGNYTIFAVYGGDKNYLASSSYYILTVNQSRSILDVEVNDVSSNDRVVIRVSLTSNKNETISGSVNVLLNGKTYAVRVSDGKGSLNIGKLNPGNYTVSAIFEGNEKYSDSSAVSSFMVSDYLLESVLTSVDVVKYYVGDVKLIASLTNSKNKPISKAELLVDINGVKTVYVTDDEGKIYVDTNYPLGKYAVNIRFEGSDSYYPSQTNATIEILSTIESEDVTKLYGTGTQYFAIFKDLNGKALSNTEVFFKINNKIYNYTTFPNGIVRLNINLRPGVYDITAINPVTGENATNKLTMYLKLMYNKDVVNYFGAKSIYKVRAYGSDGKPVGEGKVVKFIIAGKTYYAKTNKYSYAVVSVNLKSNVYKVSATYNGTTVYNKITVKPVLTTKITSNIKTKKTRFIAKLVNLKGKAVKGKIITFKINGKKFYAKTNANGVAFKDIKLTLKKGTYKMYTIYGKSIITNKIRVR
ncbi:MAG: Ig-like domain repeat protein [Methanobrevibacter sp.]|nr:Ig-like domain repeat protein [Methanobrevibacter sp.]